MSCFMGMFANIWFIAVVCCYRQRAACARLVLEHAERLKQQSQQSTSSEASAVMGNGTTAAEMGVDEAEFQQAVVRLFG